MIRVAYGRFFSISHRLVKKKSCKKCCTINHDTPLRQTKKTRIEYIQSKINVCFFSLSTATFVEEQKEKAEKAQKMYMSDLAQIDKKSLILYYLIFYLFSMQEEGKKSFF